MKSAYSDYHAFIIRPVKEGGCVTKRDQKALGQLVYWKRANFCIVIFPTTLREENLRRLESVKLSKPMQVTEITIKQWGLRFKYPETIKGTGVRATAKQLAETFIIEGCKE